MRVLEKYRKPPIAVELRRKLPARTQSLEFLFAASWLPRRYRITAMGELYTLSSYQNFTIILAPGLGVRRSNRGRSQYPFVASKPPSSGRASTERYQKPLCVRFLRGHASRLLHREHVGCGPVCCRCAGKVVTRRWMRLLSRILNKGCRPPFSGFPSEPLSQQPRLSSRDFPE